MTTTRATTKAHIVCVRCSQDVRGPVVGPVGTRHAGHVDPRLDTTCGIWGYRRARASERGE